MNGIAERLARVKEDILRAATASRRDPGEIRLVAVSKTKPAEMIREAYACGQRDFGENYVQELVAKAEALADLTDLRFHLIGHLQRNKAKLVAKVASVVHTVDSVRLAEELGKRAAEYPVPAGRAFSLPGRASGAWLPVLVEVNVGGEEQKSGVSPKEVPLVLEAIERAPALRLAGLMTVPPFTEDEAASASYFRALRELRDEHGGAARLPELSMGMSRDLRHAIAEGATIVRVGTAIFGER